MTTTNLKLSMQSAEEIVMVNGAVKWVRKPKFSFWDTMGLQKGLIRVHLPIRAEHALKGQYI